MLDSRAAFALCFVAACSHEWDAFDPRLGTTGGDGGGGAPPATSGTTSLTTGTSTTASSATTSTTTSAAGGGGEGPGQVTYTAVVADCIKPSAPDPDVCETEAGSGVMTVDTQFNPMLDPTPRNAYIRFDLDGALAGKTVDAATLTLRVTSISGGESNQTGELWEVEPFVRADLFVMTPATIGATPIGANQGAVALGAQVDFSIPTSLVSPNDSVTVGLLPLTTNGVDYYNTNGVEPPILVIDYH